jgi:phage-related protein
MEEDKPLIWIGSSKGDLSAFPDDVKLVMGFALRIAQKGGKHRRTKPLKGHAGAGVLEVVDDYDGNTYRAVYTVSFPGFVYALHAFQKKSKKGKATATADLEMIQRRLRAARIDFEERVQSGQSDD